MRHSDVAERMKNLLIQRGAQDVIISLIEEEKNQLKFSNHAVSTTQSWDSFVLQVFAVFSKKIVMTALHVIPEDEATLKKEVDKLIKFSSVLHADAKYHGIAKGPFSYKTIPGVYDSNIEKRNFDAVDILEKAIATSKEHGAERSAGVFETSTVKEALFSSSDVSAETKRTALRFSIRSFADHDASGHSVVNTTSIADCDVHAAALRATNIARDALHPQKGEAGMYDVLFEPLAASSFIQAAGSAASAFSVETGLSCLNGALNKQVANEKVSLVDNPHLPNSIGSVPFDAEGVPTQKTTIIEKGILKNYLHNTSTAQRFNTTTTGNAGLISPEAHNTVLENGNVNKSALFEHIKKGLWITNVWYTRFQSYESGDFSTIPRDGIFLIENGEIKQSVKDIRISENVIHMLKNIELIGNDAQQVAWWEREEPCTTPSVVLKGVNITKSTK